MAAAITTNPAFSSGTPAAVLDRGNYQFPDSLRQYDVASDGRFLMMKGAEPDDETEPSQIIVVQNWFSELERLAPAAE